MHDELEGAEDIGALLGRCLEEVEPLLLGKRERFLLRDFTNTIQIALVANQEDLHIHHIGIIV